MWYWLALLIAAGALEYAAHHVTGATLSQHLWRLHRRRPSTRWLTLGVLVLLTIHLVWRWP